MAGRLLGWKPKLVMNGQLTRYGEREVWQTRRGEKQLIPQLYSRFWWYVSTTVGSSATSRMRGSFDFQVLLVPDVIIPLSGSELPREKDIGSWLLL